MEESKNSDKHGTYWAANLLCVCQKKQLEMVCNELFVQTFREPHTNYTNIVVSNKMSQAVVPDVRIYPYMNEFLKFIRNGTEFCMDFCVIQILVWIFARTQSF